jgi:hypothetical protein
MMTKSVSDFYCPCEGKLEEVDSPDLCQSGTEMDERVVVPMPGQHFSQSRTRGNNHNCTSCSDAGSGKSGCFNSKICSDGGDQKFRRYSATPDPHGNHASPLSSYSYLVSFIFIAILALGCGTVSGKNLNDMMLMDVDEFVLRYC